MWNPYFVSLIISGFSPEANYVLQKQQSAFHKVLKDFAGKKSNNIGSMPNNYIVTIDLMNLCIIAPHQVRLNRL